MAWIRVNVSPKISSQSAGWMARVYISVRSCRILRSSTQQSVTIRLSSWRTTASGVSSGRTGSAEATRSAPGLADVTDSSLAGVVESVAGVVAEHRVQGGPATQFGLELRGGPGGPQGAAVHQRDPVAVGVRFVHVVGRHQDRHRVGLAQPGDEVPHVGTG